MNMNMHACIYIPDVCLLMDGVIVGVRVGVDIYIYIYTYIHTRRLPAQSRGQGWGGSGAHIRGRITHL
jgi:hypothetical protein